MLQREPVTVWFLNVLDNNHNKMEVVIKAVFFCILGYILTQQSWDLIVRVLFILKVYVENHVSFSCLYCPPPKVSKLVLAGAALLGVFGPTHTAVLWFVSSWEISYPEAGVKERPTTHCWNEYDCLSFSSIDTDKWVFPPTFQRKSQSFLCR